MGGRTDRLAWIKEGWRSVPSVHSLSATQLLVIVGAPYTNALLRLNSHSPIPFSECLFPLTTPKRRRRSLRIVRLHGYSPPSMLPKTSWRWAKEGPTAPHFSERGPLAYCYLQQLQRVVIFACPVDPERTHAALSIARRAKRIRKSRQGAGHVYSMIGW